MDWSREATGPAEDAMRSALLTNIRVLHLCVCVCVDSAVISGATDYRRGKDKSIYYNVLSTHTHTGVLLYASVCS